MSVLLAASFLAAAPAIVPTPAQAQSLLENLFPRAAERRREKLQRRYERQLQAQQAWERAQRAEQRRARQQARKRARAAAPVTVKAPTFKTYVANPIGRIDLASLATSFRKAEEQGALAWSTNQRELAAALVAKGYSLDNIAGATRSEPNAGITLVSGADDLAAIEVSAENALAKAVLAHYEANPVFLWIDGEGQPNDKATALLDLFADAAAYGFDADDYAVATPDDTLTTAALGTGDSSASTLRGAMQFEFAMTAAALRYGIDARHGRVDPDRISRYHDFRANERKPAETLAALAVADDPVRLLLDAHPRDEAFAALKAELASLDTSPKGPPPVRIADGTFIRPGQTNDQLAGIVEGIRRKSDVDMLSKHAAVFANPPLDGLYSPEIVALVRDFQKAQQLGPDGVVGKNTIAKVVGGTVENKREKVILAMERLRWHPDTLGSTHVFINQPAYRATLIRGGQPELSMRAIVGTVANQTNFFHDTIDYVEYNPYWGVPKSILVNEMLPKLRSNPGYLDQRDYEITTASGRPVSGWNVDWWGVGGDFPYNVRQRPGPENALGELKIMFPNKHHIYMHDTPARNLFQRDARALSHGCVRLADPKAMAAAVLGSTRDDVQARISSGRNNSQKLQRKMPVYVAYFTAWPEADGTVNYFGDIYGRDDALAKAMSLTRQARAQASNI